MFGLLKRMRENIRKRQENKNPFAPTVRVVGRGGLQQDLDSIYESENFKRAQTYAHLIVSRDKKDD